MATSTAITTLSYSTTSTGTFTKLVDIVSYPDLGGTPSKLDTTDLSATKYKTSILGLQEIPDLTFECNYDKVAYEAIEALGNTTYFFKLDFGTAGADGIFKWSGQASVFVTGSGVDEVRKMSVTLSAQTPITIE